MLQSNFSKTAAVNEIGASQSDAPGVSFQHISRTSGNGSQSRRAGSIDIGERAASQALAESDQFGGSHHIDCCSNGICTIDGGSPAQNLSGSDAFNGAEPVESMADIYMSVLEVIVEILTCDGQESSSIDASCLRRDAGDGEAVGEGVSIAGGSNRVSVSLEVDLNGVISCQSSGKTSSDVGVV